MAVGAGDWCVARCGGRKVRLQGVAPQPSWSQVLVNLPGMLQGRAKVQHALATMPFSVGDHEKEQLSPGGGSHGCWGQEVVCHGTA